ncbi:LON peptidase substrate-binding domain-containing protein [Lewinella cohaerens]|uniref:LON peptidase substrate-binding domain-containing protein n=1 Tax=Lewinella cohaerens TaxID=70995 RepID=UPI00035CB24E|nr:LON peptidase substrate-binding domain-containing protein [Lewinella cohaerens]
MPRQIALFPLQIVVFPGEAVNLHIFEERYRKLIKDCEEDGITFGIPTYQNGSIKEFGTEVRLLNIEKVYPGGEMDVKTEALGIFRIKDFYPTLENKPYAGGLVNDYEIDLNEAPHLNEQILAYAKRLFAAMKIKRLLPEDASNFTTYDIAHFVGFDPEQEYQFLTTFNAASRQQLIIEQISRILPIVKEMENLRDRAKMNGHFKNLIPPEI